MDQTNTVSYSCDQYFFHVKTEKKSYVPKGRISLSLKDKKKQLVSGRFSKKRNQVKTKQKLPKQNQTKKTQSKPKQKRSTTKQKKNSLLGLCRCIFCPFRTGVTNSKFLKNRKCMFGLLFWNLGSSRWYFRTVCIIHLSIMVGEFAPVCPTLKHLLCCIKRASHLWFFFKLLSTITLPFCSWLSLTLLFHLPSVNPQATHISYLAANDLTIHMTVQKWGVLAFSRYISTLFFFQLWKQNSIMGIHMRTQRDSHSPVISHRSHNHATCSVSSLHLCSYTAFSRRASKSSLSAAHKFQRTQLVYWAVQLNSMFPIFPKSEFCCVLERQETLL